MGEISELLDVYEYTADGYKPVVDYDAWRVAVLNFSDSLRIDNISALQRHNETDEVFVLLCGRCILFVAEEDVSGGIGHIFAVNMEPLKIYNVRKSVWHNHTLSRDAKLLIVENRDTTYDNSPFGQLSPGQQEEICQLTRNLWQTPAESYE